MNETKGTSVDIPVQHGFSLFGSVMRFELNLEKEFKNFYLQQNQWRILTGAVAGLLFFSVMPWLGSSFFALNAFPEIWIMSLGIICPVFLIVIISFLDIGIYVAKYPVLFFSVLVSGIGTIAMGVMLQLQGETFPYEILILLTIYTYFFSGLLFLPAVISSLSVMLVYLTITFINHSGQFSFMHEFFYLFYANSAGALGCYLYEKTMRNNFINQRKLEDMAQKDVLTGIYNRRFFEENYQRIWRQASREEKYLSVMLVDVDLFKNYNDCYGHVSGDKCLNLIANTLSSLVKRPLDMVSRYGGEEFVVVCYNARREFALSLAEQMCEGIESLNIPHSNSHVSGHVTLSIGAAVIIPVSGFSAEYLLETADNALYEAKRTGRNKVVIQELGDFNAISEPHLQSSANQWAQRKQKNTDKSGFEYAG